MPHWVLRCPSCHREFFHSQIEVRTAEDYFLGEVKPEFPRGGVRLNCPNCQASSVYQRTELMYRKDPVPPYFAEPTGATRSAAVLHESGSCVTLLLVT